MSTVGLPPPMRADARRNRELLIAAALEAFTERGADDTSLEEIARRAGEVAVQRADPDPRPARDLLQ